MASILQVLIGALHEELKSGQSAGTEAVASALHDSVRGTGLSLLQISLISLLDGLSSGWLCQQGASRYRTSPPPNKNPLHSPTLSCKNEQFLCHRFDAMLTGVTLIYLGG